MHYGLLAVGDMVGWFCGWVVCRCVAVVLLLLCCCVIRVVGVVGVVAVVVGVVGSDTY